MGAASACIITNGTAMADLLTRSTTGVLTMPMGPEMSVQLAYVPAGRGAPRLMLHSGAAESASHAASVLPIVAVSRTLRVTEDAALGPTGTALSTSGWAYICSASMKGVGLTLVSVCPVLSIEQGCGQG